MQGSRSLGRGTITGLLYDLGPYPAVVHGAGKVWGEVFEVDATVLAALDAIEAFYPDAPADKSGLTEQAESGRHDVHLWPWR